MLAPHEIDLSLKTTNGGLTVADVRGNLTLEATNGGISIEGVGGNVRGRTTNGGVTATLRGDAWDGAGLDLRTTNGGVRLPAFPKPIPRASRRARSMAASTSIFRSP